MVQISRSRFLAAICALSAFAGLSASAYAEEYATNLGPVGPNEPILANIGGQRVIAFFTPERGACAVNTIVWKDAGPDAPYTSSRVRVTLRPGQMVRFDDARLSMNLLCGADASTLAMVAPAELILTGTHANN
jgi:hypothetical protein